MLCAILTHLRDRGDKWLWAKEVPRKLPDQQHLSTYLLKVHLDCPVPERIGSNVRKLLLK